MLDSINHITLAVTNIDQSFSFYRDVMGLTPLVRWDRGAYFLVGQVESSFWFCLNVDPKHEPNPGYTHYAFTVSPLKFKKVSEKILNLVRKSLKKIPRQGSLYISLIQIIIN